MGGGGEGRDRRVVYMDTGKNSSVWTSCCSKNVSTNSAILLIPVTALLWTKLLIGNCCSNNLPVKTESVQES